MRKVYIIVYSDAFGTRDEVRTCFQQIKEIKHWRYDMPNSFYIVSELSATELSRMIQLSLKKGRYLITEISDNRNGLLPKETWTLFKTKTKSPKAL